LDTETVVRSQGLADTVPFYGEGDPIPADRDLSAKDDTSGFVAVVQLLIRCWPYISPQILGRWWVPGAGIEQRMAELIGGRGFSFVYMPPLVTLIAVIAPYYGFVPTSLEYPFNLFYGLVAITVISTWPLPHLSGRVQGVSLVVLLLSTILANMVAVVLIEGSVHSIYVGLITVACLLGWVVQLRLGSDGLKFRFRVASHIIYYYGLTLIMGLGFMLLGLLMTEIVNQSLLQNEPLMPGLASMIGYPEMSSAMADTLTQAQRMELRWAPIKVEFALFLLLWPLEIVLLYYVVWIFQRINHDLRLALVDRWHRLSLRHHADHRVGDSIWRIQSDSETVTSVLKVVGELVTMTMSIVTALALITLLSPLLGSIAAFVVVPTLILARWAMPRFRTRSLVQRMANADLTSRVQESFRSIKLTKAYQAGTRSQKKFEDDSMIAFNAEYRNARLGFRVGVITDFYAEMFIFGGILLMALWVNNGDSTFATELIALAGLSFVVWNLSAFRWASERHEESIRSMAGVMRMWGWAQDVAMGLKRVFDILDMELEVTDREDAIPFQGFEREIRFDNVAFAYSSDRPVLDGINLTAVPGTVTAIVGPTGSGKSTLMNLLLRLFDPDRGAISIDGHDLREFSVDSLRKNIAIALQENVLFGMTIRENIRYAMPDADDERVNEAVRIACLEESVAALPKGLDTMLGDRGGRLSTGQRQRLSIARAIVRETPVLVLDEPTAALDADTEHRVLGNLGEWAKDPGATSRAIFLITHRISTIRRADNIVYLEEGRVAESGNHETLMGIENGRYRAFVLTESGAGESLNV
jgi:ABC-type multidrug transport system fused ATPase/permease subunit